MDVSIKEDCAPLRGPRCRRPAPLRAGRETRARRFLRPHLRGRLPADLDGAGNPLSLRRTARSCCRPAATASPGRSSPTATAGSRRRRSLAAPWPRTGWWWPTTWPLTSPSATRSCRRRGLSCTPVRPPAAGWESSSPTATGPLDLTVDERRTMRALGRTAALATTSARRPASSSGAPAAERIDLAREVHESVMQRLFGVSMVLGSDRPAGG